MREKREETRNETPDRETKGVVEARVNKGSHAGLIAYIEMMINRTKEGTVSSMNKNEG
jgi:hypothetical protein